jgi:acetyl esterase
MKKKQKKQSNGMIHDFGLLNGLATLPAVRSHIRQIGAELKKYLV